MTDALEPEIPGRGAAVISVRSMLGWLDPEPRNNGKSGRVAGSGMDPRRTLAIDPAHVVRYRSGLHVY